MAMARKSRHQNAVGSDRLRVASVQMKFAPTIDENLATIERLVGEAARRGADAVLLPECATTGYAYDFSRLTPPEVRARVVKKLRRA
jgi:predicted amidohydrolase